MQQGTSVCHFQVSDTSQCKASSPETFTDLEFNSKIVSNNL